jgi:outer membrane lipoprotein-sorting protein
MDKMRKIILLIVGGLFLFVNAQSVIDIMNKVDTRDDGDTLINDMSMVLIDKNKKIRKRSMKTYSKDYGKDSKRLIFFITPADVKNTAFLTYDYYESSKDDDQWLYLPALKKIKRIPSSDKSGSFMGSDFSYSDMTQKIIDDYKFKLIKESTLKNNKIWIIEAIPKKQKTIDETGYKKSILFVRKDNYMLVRAIYYPAIGNKKKYFDTNNIEKIDGIWIAKSTSMTTKDGKTTLHKTVLNFSNFKVNSKINDNLFSTRRLQKGL